MKSRALLDGRDARRSTSCICSRAMNNDDNHSGEREVQERIKSLMQAAGQIPRKQITGKELQTLKTAVSRLDQMLKSTADADLQALRSGAARLDQLLADIGTGKDFTSDLKRRRDWQKRGE